MSSAVNGCGQMGRHDGTMGCELWNEAPKDIMPPCLCTAPIPESHIGRIWTVTTAPNPGNGYKKCLQLTTPNDYETSRDKSVSISEGKAAGILDIQRTNIGSDLGLEGSPGMPQYQTASTRKRKD